MSAATVWKTFKSTVRSVSLQGRSGRNSISEEVQEPDKELKQMSELPGPRVFPIIGNAPYFVMKKDPRFHRMKSDIFWKEFDKNFGPIFLIKIPTLPTMVGITDPEDTKKLHQATMKDPVISVFNSIKMVRYNHKYFDKKGGILVENKEEWRRVRSRVQTPMMKKKNIIKYLPEVEKVSLSFIDRIEHLQSNFGEMPEDFVFELHKWALESMGVIALNRRLGCFDLSMAPDSEQMQLINNASKFFDSLNKTEMGIGWWRLFPTKEIKDLEECHEVFLDTAVKAVKETKEMIQHKPEDSEFSFIETLLNIEGLTDKDVVTTVLDILMAGIDTTSHSTAFALTCLANNKEAQRKLQDEVDAVLGDGQESITEAHLDKLSYLKACVKESMRLYPPVLGHARILTKDLVLSGYLIPKGIQVFYFAMLMANNEKYFARPSEYLPERWARDQPMGSIHPYASLPFSHGPRMCIGRRISEQQIFTFLARIFHQYDVHYNHKDKPIELLTSFVSRPSQPLKFEFKKRTKI